MTNRRDAVVLDNAADDDPVRSVLTLQSRRRLSNQVARAYRGTYGARTGLRTLGRQFALRLLDAGCSPEAVTVAFARVVLEHSSSTLDGGRALVTPEPRSTALVELTRQAVADAVLELSKRPDVDARRS